MFYFTFISEDNYRRYNTNDTAHLILSNDSLVNDLEFSLDGSQSIGILLPEETIEFRDVNIQALHIKSRLAAASCVVRVWFFGQKQLLYDKENIDKTDRQVPVHRTFEKVEL